MGALLLKLVHHVKLSRVLLPSLSSFTTTKLSPGRMKAMIVANSSRPSRYGRIRATWCNAHANTSFGSHKPIAIPTDGDQSLSPINSGKFNLTMDLILVE